MFENRTAIIAGGQGIGFAIPIDLANNIIEQLKTNGEVTRGWLGITIQDLKGDLAEYHNLKDTSGVLVTEVIPGDPADKAGIKAKDIITKVNGEKVTTSRKLTARAAKLTVGEKATVTVFALFKNFPLPQSCFSGEPGVLGRTALGLEDADWAFGRSFLAAQIPFGLSGIGPNGP